MFHPTVRQRVLAAMRQARAVVNSSRSEGSCGALLEAMAIAEEQGRDVEEAVMDAAHG